MFPQALCDALSNLHSGAPMHSWDFSHALLCQAVAGPLDSYFDSIDTTAFASGSIAQVPSSSPPTALGSQMPGGAGPRIAGTPARTLHLACAPVSGDFGA